MTLGLGEGEYYQGFFNELKQEFVSARYLLFEGLAAKAPHFSDRDVTIADTLDQPVYSLASQKLRLAFRSASSLFDKAAVFLNYYLALEIPERQVTFRTIWYTKQDRTHGIRSEFRDRENAWIRALFALSLDTFDNAVGFADVSEPDAKPFTRCGTMPSTNS
jgi:LA2681-like HEPN